MNDNLEQLRSKKGFICDMDGVIYHGNRLLKGVPEFVEWLQKENKSFLFLTNSSERSPLELQQKLARMGLDIGVEHFYTSALATAKFVASQKPGASAYVIGAPGLVGALYEAGIVMNDVDPDYHPQGGRPGQQRRAPDCDQLRPDRPLRAGHHPRLPRACRPDRAGNRQAGLLRRQAQPADDAHRPAPAGRALARGCHGR